MGVGVSEDDSGATTTNRPTPNPVPPRALVAVVTLAATGIMGYSAFRADYKSMIVAALVVLFTLGADLGAILRGWRGQ